MHNITIFTCEHKRALSINMYKIVPTPNISTVVYFVFIFLFFDKSCPRTWTILLFIYYLWITFDFKIFWFHVVFKRKLMLRYPHEKCQRALWMQLTIKGYFPNFCYCFSNHFLRAFLAFPPPPYWHLAQIWAAVTLEVLARLL